MDLSGLNFQPGAGVQAAIGAHYGEPVNFFPISGLKEFFLLVSMANCKYKLSKFSIGMILHATIGGVSADFRPQHIFDRVFKYMVASKNVGFHIYNLRSFCCDQYKIFFNLWSNGGVDWVSKLENYAMKEDQQWSIVLSVFLHQKITGWSRSRISSCEVVS
jgi:hypothetical protein